MTRIPFHCRPPSPSKPSASLLRSSSSFAPAMDGVRQEDAGRSPSGTLIYPTPLSPPLPAISKQVELARAMTASSKSSLFTISRAQFVYEDDSIVVINKPSGVYCESVLSAIQRLFEDSNAPTPSEEGNESCPVKLHLANRLDRDTSGLMVITKSNKVAAKLVKAFTEHRVKKTYLALCVGPAPKWDKISLKSGHGRSKFGAFRVYAASDIGRNLPGGSMVRDMVTSFEVLSINGQGEFHNPNRPLPDELLPLVVEDRGLIQCVTGEKEMDEILIRAYPKSGRTHQIRLHCQHLGIPIIGDVKYEGVYEWKGKTYESHALHAESLSLAHPVTGNTLNLQAPLPEWCMIQIT